jgi:hypothetical protein
MVASTASHLSLQELLGSIVAFEGVTSTDGAVGKTSLIDAQLISTNDWVTGKSVVILDGLAAHEDKLATAFNIATGEVTFAAMSSRILAGTSYIILNLANPGTSLIAVIATLAAILANTIGTVSTAGSPFSLVNNLLEQDAVIIAAATQLVDIELDLNTLTQINTIREYVKVDAANYRQISAKTFPADFDTGTKAITLSFPQKGQLYKVTMQASGVEGAARDVPFRILTRDLS